MSIERLLNQKFNKSSEFTWHTNNNTHEIIIIEDNISISKLKDNHDLDVILYKGIINDNVENIINSI